MFSGEEDELGEKSEVDVEGKGKVKFIENEEEGEENKESEGVAKKKARKKGIKLKNEEVETKEGRRMIVMWKRMEISDDAGLKSVVDNVKSKVKRTNWVTNWVVLHLVASSSTPKVDTQFASKVLVSGMQRLGAKIVKNIVLASVKSVTLHDEGGKQSSKYSTVTEVKEEPKVEEVGCVQADISVLMMSENSLMEAEISAHPKHRKERNVHQVDSFKFLDSNLLTDDPRGCILAHASGSGKTFMVINSIQSFLAKNPDVRPLVILPEGILANLKKEITIWQVEADVEKKKLAMTVNYSCSRKAEAAAAMKHDPYNWLN
ncbi:unnamed protein product [Dovyalis caffra]|uniref:Uncharacterized protein n=1 Tax=Dovyalis caffra TaxID=77055 RepID=A0AAV1RML7_9ROSI|nr:unnamed protein product [Dovyalis caffra]